MVRNRINTTNPHNELIEMDEVNTLGNKKYLKSTKWSARKLQKALDEESQGTTITKSAIKKIESQIAELLAKSSEMVGTKINAEEIPEYIGKIQNKVTLVQLQMNEAEIKLLVNRLTEARQRLLDHSSSKAYLMELLKRKNQ